jgi:hypothetical protein
MVSGSEGRQGFGLFMKEVLRETVKHEGKTNSTEMERITYY